MRALALLVLACGAAGAAPVRAVDAIGIPVVDLDRSIAFYRDVLGFRAARPVEVAGEPYERLEGVFGVRMRSAELALGDERIVLTEFLAPRGRPVPPDSRSNDRWFQHIAIVVRDLDAAYARLRAHHVRQVSTGPQTLPAWNPNAGGIRAFYFTDPDDHVLELIWFPRGKGDQKWQRGGAGPFLGIDHTAIGVGDTDASLRFYRDALGMRVVGASENWGTEQEHLNNVFGAHLRITALRAAEGPGIELLEYLAPRDGRPMPELHANDLACWQTRVRGHADGAIALPDERLGFRRGALTHDPDGHTLLFVE